MAMTPRKLMLGMMLIFWLTPEISSAALIDRIVATVNGDALLLSEVDAFCRAALEDVPANMPLAQTVDRKRQIRLQTLNGLIDDLLIKQQVKVKSIKVTKEDVVKYLEQLRKLNNLTEEQFQAAIRQEGKSPEDFKRDITKQLERDKLMAREIQGRMKVTEKEIAEHYQHHYTSKTAKEKVRASHVLFAIPPGTPAEQEKTVKQRADRILKLLRGGADFVKTAKQFSDDPSASMGGDLGWFRRGDMVAAFEKSAFGLKEGQMSDLVRTRFGYHIILVTGRDQDGPPHLDKVSGEIRTKLMRERRASAIRGWLDDLRRRSHVEIRL